MKISEYYTTVSSLWEEIDSMNIFPVVTTVATDITALLAAITTQKEEARLFVFLNGLDDTYSAMRSQLLMQQPLPTVEAACAMLKQEESQREVLPIVVEGEHTAMYSKAPVDKNFLACTVCGLKNHSSDKCWSLTGFPKWHYKYKKPVQRSGGAGQNQSQPRWNSNSRTIPQKMANNVSAQNSGDQNVMFTSQQLEQLLKLMPGSFLNVPRGSDTDDELEMGFYGMVACNLSVVGKNAWIIDSGASDHMTCSVEHLSNVKAATGSNLMTTLPTGGISKITHVGGYEINKWFGSLQCFGGSRIQP